MMDTAKIFTVLTAFLLLVCLVIAVTVLTVLRNAIAENETVQKNSRSVTEDLGVAVKNLNRSIAAGNFTTPSDPVDRESLYKSEDAYCLREIDGCVGVFTIDGLPIRTWDLPVSLLPPADRESLRLGIRLATWKDVLDCIADFES